jgi:hypothetical protein
VWKFALVANGAANGQHNSNAQRLAGILKIKVKNGIIQKN